jgi:hypothetical protein
MSEREAVPYERTITMPPVEGMRQRLDGTHLPLRQQGVLFRFIHSIANQEENGTTLVSAWESACAEANKKLPLWKDRAITRLLHTLAFPSVVEAIIPDKTVAREAKEDLYFLEEIRVR